jgi:predicted amidohydrolase
MRPFNSIYTHGFVRVAVCIPSLRVADPAYNVARTIALAERASAANAAVALFPELGLSAYTCDDLFQQDALLEGVLDALNRLIDASRSLTPVLLVGAPLRIDGALYNCAIVIYHGRILGVVPKSYIPNYREFYEKRQFSAARDALRQTIMLAGATVPFGNDLIFVAGNVPGFCAACRDLRRCVGSCAAKFLRRSGRRNYPCQSVPPATSPSGKPTTGGCCAPLNPAHVSLPTSTQPPVQASRPLIWHGMDTH